MVVTLLGQGPGNQPHPRTRKVVSTPRVNAVGLRAALPDPGWAAEAGGKDQNSELLSRSPSLYAKIGQDSWAPACFPIACFLHCFSYSHALSGGAGESPTVLFSSLGNY